MVTQGCMMNVSDRDGVTTTNKKTKKGVRMKIAFASVVLLIFPLTSFSATNVQKIKSLASLAGMAEYCQIYYEGINKPFKAAIMRDYKTKISKKISVMYTSQYEVNASNAARQNAILLYQKSSKKTLGKKCKNLTGSLSLLKL